MRNNITQMIIRGQVWMADLRKDVIGSEQGGVRPVLIIQNDIGNKFSPTVTVVPLTSKQNKNKLPTHILLEDEPYLTYVSIALVEQVVTIDKRRLLEYMGAVNDLIMVEIDEALKIQTGLRKDFSFEKAYNMISQIYNTKMLIKKYGKDDRLISSLNFHINNIKEYCSFHKIDINIINQKYRSEILGIKLVK
jgi:mRNA interferase MazF